MRARAFVSYAYAKVRDQTQRDNYHFDCLWSMATDMRFVESLGKKEKSTPECRPTLPRWSELTAPKRKKAVSKVTKEDIKSRMIELREENKRRKNAKSRPADA